MSKDKFIVVEKGFCVKPEMEKPVEADYINFNSYASRLIDYKSHLLTLPRIICSPEYTVGEEIEGEIEFQIKVNNEWVGITKAGYEDPLVVADRRLVLEEEKKEPTDKELTEFASAVSLNACFSTLEQPAPIQPAKLAEQSWNERAAKGETEFAHAIDYMVGFVDGYNKAKAEQPVQESVESYIQSLSQFGGILRGDDEFRLSHLKVKDVKDIIRNAYSSALAARTEEQGDAVEFLEHIRDYEKESGKSICYDERTSNQLYQIFITSKTNKK